jgi:hypothetical protein
MQAVLLFLKKYWLWIVVAIGVLLLFGIGKSLINRIKVFSNMGDFGENPEGIDYVVLAQQINEAFHGGLTENEERVISIINSMPSKKEYTKLVQQYAKTAGKDLRNDCIKYMREKQYSKLKYQ